MVDSSKLFIVTDKFWVGKDQPGKPFPLVIATDTKAPTLYTLDFGHPTKGVVLITYAWENHSTQLAAIADPQKLRANLAQQIGRITKEFGFPEYESYITRPEDEVFFIHWQKEIGYHGAFTLAQPGQLINVRTATFDFLRILEPDYNGVSLIGDSITFSGGWTESALQPAINAVSALLKRYGVELNAPDLAPVNLLKDHAHTYYYDILERPQKQPEQPQSLVKKFINLF